MVRRKGMSLNERPNENKNRKCCILFKHRGKKKKQGCGTVEKNAVRRGKKEKRDYRGKRINTELSFRENTPWDSDRNRGGEKRQPAKKRKIKHPRCHMWAKMTCWGRRK